MKKRLVEGNKKRPENNEEILVIIKPNFSDFNSEYCLAIIVAPKFK